MKYTGFANYEEPNELLLEFKQLEIDPLFMRNTQPLDYTKTYRYEISDQPNGNKKVVFNPPLVNDVGVFYWPEDEHLPEVFVDIDSELIEQ